MEIVLLVFLVVLAVCCIWGFWRHDGSISRLEGGQEAQKIALKDLSDGLHHQAQRFEELAAKLDDQKIWISHNIDSSFEKAFGAIDGLAERVSALEAPPAPPEPGHCINRIVDAASALGPEYTVSITRDGREVCTVRAGNAVYMEEC